MNNLVIMVSSWSFPPGFDMILRSQGSSVHRGLPVQMDAQAAEMDIGDYLFCSEYLSALFSSPQVNVEKSFSREY